jgi:hypothetical protein
MRKINFLKAVLGVACAMLMTTGVFGQQKVPETDFAKYNVDTLTVDSIDYVTNKETTGTTMRYFALPDPVYHPNYTLGNDFEISNGFSWTWTSSDAGVVFAPGATVADTNVVDITFPDALDSYTINVRENAPAAFGGCNDATPTKLRVHVIAPPTAYFTSTDSTSNCGDLATQNLVIQFDEDVPVVRAAYAFRIRLTVENLDAAGNVLGASVVSYPINYNALVADAKARVGVTAGFAATATPGEFEYTYATPALPLVAGHTRTRYTYALLNATDVITGTGLVSAISQKSDYLTALNTYAFGTDASVVYYINPAPVTGPIYHVPNDFNY